jgi:hypothetical protein
MTISKQIVMDQITIAEDGVIYCREATRIMEDGMQISQTYHRLTFSPISNLNDLPNNVKAIADVVWTPEVVSAYQAQIPRPEML